MKCCPYCESKEYYTKEYAFGDILVSHRFDNEEPDNSDMHNSLRYKLKSKYAYCKNCDKKIFKII